jgi:hypothetical protein
MFSAALVSYQELLFRCIYSIVLEAS